MTEASDVHLFAWIKENAVMIGSFLAVMWAMAIWSLRTFFQYRDSKFASVDDLNACRDKNTEEHADIRQQMTENHNEVKTLFITHLGREK